MVDFLTADYTKLLPPVLAADETMSAIAIATAAKLLETSSSIKNATIYPRIDELDEQTLDTLAVDFNVVWYSSTASLAVKRKTIKNAFKVHKYVGTKFAVEEGIKSFFKDVEVKEWFEYDGTAYHFKAEIIVETAPTSAEKSAVLKAISSFKNARSVLDGVTYKQQQDTSTDMHIGTEIYSARKKITTEVTAYELD